MHNVYARFRQLLPEAPLQAGTVTEIGSGGVTVQLPGGGLLQARGSTEIGQQVFVRDGVLEGSAPNLTLELIEI